MRIQPALLSAVTSFAVLGFGLAAQADTTPARCELYAPGEDYASLASNCSFSQRQGYISIQMQSNGVRYEFSPLANSRPGNFRDQYGQAVYRQSGLGSDGTIFEFVDGSHLYVYWDGSTGSGTQEQSGTRIGTLVAHERGSQINLRSQPTARSRPQGYGLAGDQVKILECVVDQDTVGSTLNWCRVQFLVSGAIGWVRSDFIIFPSDGAL